MSSQIHDKFHKVLCGAIAISGAIYGYFQVEYGDSVFTTMLYWSFTAILMGAVIYIPLILILVISGTEIRSSSEDE